MSNETLQVDRTALIQLLVDLAGALDGVADWGMIVCATKEEEVAGRHLWIEQHSDRIQLIVNSLVAVMTEATLFHAKELPALQADLSAGADQFLHTFRALEHFRTLRPARVRSLGEALRTGWETVHRVIREIADTWDLPDRSWYLPILERQDTFRTQLGNYCSHFVEEVSHSQNE